MRRSSSMSHRGSEPVFNCTNYREHKRRFAGSGQKPLHRDDLRSDGQEEQKSNDFLHQILPGIEKHFRGSGVDFRIDTVELTDLEKSASGILEVLRKHSDGVFTKIALLSLLFSGLKMNFPGRTPVEAAIEMTARQVGGEGTLLNMLETSQQEASGYDLSEDLTAVDSFSAKIREVAARDDNLDEGGRSKFYEEYSDDILEELGLLQQDANMLLEHLPYWQLAARDGDRKSAEVVTKMKDMYRGLRDLMFDRLEGAELDPDFSREVLAVDARERVFDDLKNSEKGVRVFLRGLGISDPYVKDSRAMVASVLNLFATSSDLLTCRKKFKEPLIAIFKESPEAVIAMVKNDYRFIDILENVKLGELEKHPAHKFIMSLVRQHPQELVLILNNAGTASSRLLTDVARRDAYPDEQLRSVEFLSDLTEIMGKHSATGLIYYKHGRDEGLPNSTELRFICKIMEMMFMENDDALARLLAKVRNSIKDDKFRNDLFSFLSGKVNPDHGLGGFSDLKRVCLSEDPTTMLKSLSNADGMMDMVN